MVYSVCEDSTPERLFKIFVHKKHLHFLAYTQNNVKTIIYLHVLPASKLTYQYSG